MNNTKKSTDDPTAVDPVSADIGNPNDLHDDDWEKAAWDNPEDVERRKDEPAGVDVGLGTRGDLPDSNFRDDLDTLDPNAPFRKSNKTEENN